MLLTTWLKSWKSCWKPRDRRRIASGITRIVHADIRMQGQSQQTESLESRQMLSFSPIRVQNSRPGAPVTIYLDFDGEAPFYWDAGGGHYLINGPGGQTDPVPGFSFDGVSSAFTPEELDGIDAIWAQTAEKFSPFEINVTTVRPASFNDAEAIHIIIGGSQFDWYNPPVSLGGVAPFEGFTRSEEPNEGFVFSADAIDVGSTSLSEGDRHFLAESIAHEAGHLLGLHHQSVVTGNVVNIVYSPGDSITAPIMGASANNRMKRGIWFNGLTSTTDINNNNVPVGPQDDMAVMTRPGTNISYRPDDFGSFSGAGALTVNTQTGIASGAGVIERRSDQDAFTFIATGPVLSFTVEQFQSLIPLGVASTMTSGMLAPTLELIPISGNTPAITLTTTNTSATIGTANATPGQGFMLRVSPQGNAYGNVGQYTIKGNVGTFATLNAGRVAVKGYDTNNNFKISYNSVTDNIVLQNDVFGGSAVQFFPRNQVTEINVSGRNGNDTFDIFGQFSVLNISVTVNGDNGSDTLVLQGTTGNDYQAILPSRGIYGTFQSNNTPGFYDDLENVILTGFDGADTFDVYETDATLSTTIYGGNQDDVFNVGASPFGSTLVSGPVAVFGDAGNDTLNVGSNNADSLLSNITFNGGASSNFIGDRIVINDTAALYNVRYDITSTSIVRDGLNAPQTIGYSNVDGIVINAGSGADTLNVLNGVAPGVIGNGNNGNDNFIVGGGNMTGFVPQTFNGGGGIDRITFDDHLDATSRIWDVKPDEVLFGGLISLFTTAFESVGILAGNGNDEITFAGTINQALDIDGGGGADAFILGYQGAVLFNAGTNSLRGGTSSNDAEDTFTINDASVGGGTTVSLDGGNSFNSMSVNESFPVGFTLGVGYFYAEGNGRFDFANIETQVYNGNVKDNIYTILSAGSLFGTITVNGNLGNDTFRLAPQPGGYTYQNLSLNGNQGNDIYIYDATTLSTNESYTVGTNFISRQIGGFGSETVTTTSMNTITLTCGGGDDSIFMSQYSTGIPVTVNGGLGDDVCNFGGGDVAANITSLPSFLFNGNEGTDTFNLQNATAANSFSYTAAANTTLQVSRTFPSSYFLWLEYYNTEQKAVYAGPAVDIMNITSFASGELSFHGAGGDDALNLPTSSDFLGQRVNFYGDEGSANRINQITNSKTAPSTLHVVQSTIGASPGDDFFAPGGSVFFDSVQIVNLRMGIGADMAYIQPDAVAAISINGGDPTTAPGDMLNLILEAAQDYSINGTSANGNVTSSNLRTLIYTGFETGPNLVTAIPVVTLTNATPTLPENTNTNIRIKVADVVVTDDGLGTNVVTLSGPDAANFDVDATGLYLKAGTVLDFETKTSYAVTVRVDDSTVGGSPDSSVDFSLEILDRSVNWIGGSGDWNIVTNWQDDMLVNRLPGAFDDAVIDVAAAITVTHSTGTHTVQSLTINEPFTLSGGTLIVNGNLVQLNSNTFTMTAGKLGNATLVGGGGAVLLAEGGTLDGVTVGASVGGVPTAATVLSNNNFAVTGGLTFANGSLLDLGHQMSVNGDQIFGGDGEIRFRQAYSAIYTSGHIQFGPGLTIHRSDAGSSDITVSFGGSITNQGTIRADAGGHIRVFNNLGSASFTNAFGAVLAADGGTLNLAADWSNVGQIVVDNSTLNLGGSFTTAGIGNINRTGGTINLIGRLDNTGSTLVLDVVTGSWDLGTNGRLRGGSLVTTGGAVLNALAGTLDGLTLGDTVAGTSVSATVLGTSGVMIVTGGLTFTNGSLLDLGNYLNLDGDQTLSGDGEIRFRGPNSGITNYFQTTFGSGLTIHRADTFRSDINMVAGSITNYGTIRSDAGGEIRVAGNPGTSFTNAVGGVLSADGGTLSLLSAWSNAGQIVVNNSTINMGGSFTTEGLGTYTRTGGTINLIGLLDNTGRIFSLDATTGSWNLNSGLAELRGGNLVTAGGAALVATGGSSGHSGTLNGVTLGATVAGVPASATVRGNSGVFTVTGGLTFINGALLDLSNGISLVGDQTLGGDGEIRLRSGAGISNFGQTTFGLGLTIRSEANASIINMVSGSITNQGTIRTDAGQLSVSGNPGTTFTNTATGLLTAAGGTFIVNTTANYVAGTLTGGTWQAIGNGILRITGANITTNAAAIILDGLAARITQDNLGTNALSTLTTNAAAGSLTLRNASNLTTAGPFSSNGSLAIGPASTLTVNGTFTHRNTAALTIEIGGTPASGLFGKLVSSGAVTLDGTLNVRLLNGYIPDHTLSFPILTFASRTSDFSTITGLSVAGTQIFEAVYEATHLKLKSESNSAPTAVTLTNVVTSLDQFTSVANRIRVADVVVTDDALGTNALSLSGPDAGSFEVIATAIYLKAGTILNANAKPAYMFQIDVTDHSLGATPTASVSGTLAVTTSVPTILGPLAPTIDMTPEFTWTSIAGAVRYEMTIRKVTTNGSVFISAPTSATNSYTPTADLGIGRFNFWVRSVNSSNVRSRWSPAVSINFTTPVTINPLAELRQLVARPKISWQSLPGAVTYNLQVTNVSTNQARFVDLTGITGTTWTHTSDLAIGRYNIWVRGVDAAGIARTWSIATSFVVAPAPVVTPVSSTFDRTPTFQWSSVTGATRYEIIAKKGSVVAIQQFVTTSSFTRSVAMADGLYVWRVRAVSAQNYSSNFTTDQPIFVGGRPVVTGISGNTTPTFSWLSVQGAATYQIRVDRVGGLSNVINVSRLTSTTYTAVTPLATGTYRFWVRAVSTSPSETSVWSLATNFTVASAKESENNASDELSPWLNINLARLTSAEPSQPKSEMKPIHVEASTIVREAEFEYVLPAPTQQLPATFRSRQFTADHIHSIWEELDAESSILDQILTELSENNFLEQSCRG